MFKVVATTSSWNAFSKYSTPYYTMDSVCAVGVNLTETDSTSSIEVGGSGKAKQTAAMRA
jgi:hypothetical protein